MEVTKPVLVETVSKTCFKWINHNISAPFDNKFSTIQAGQVKTGTIPVFLDIIILLVYVFLFRVVICCYTMWNIKITPQHYTYQLHWVYYTSLRCKILPVTLVVIQVWTGHCAIPWNNSHCSVGRWCNGQSKPVVMRVFFKFIFLE